jgi:hypothetical protein
MSLAFRLLQDQVPPPGDERQLPSGLIRDTQMLYYYYYTINFRGRSVRGETRTEISDCSKISGYFPSHLALSLLQA